MVCSLSVNALIILADVSDFFFVRGWGKGGRRPSWWPAGGVGFNGKQGEGGVSKEEAWGARDTGGWGVSKYFS